MEISKRPSGQSGSYRGGRVTYSSVVMGGGSPLAAAATLVACQFPSLV